MQKFTKKIPTPLVAVCPPFPH